MSGRSTTSNLVQFVHTANLSSIDSKQLDVIYTDFNKAFDHLKCELLELHPSILNLEK